MHQRGKRERRGAPVGSHRFEDMESLQTLAVGLTGRYHGAGQEPPVLLYTDRDCCSQQGPSKYQQLFASWPGLQVRLDIWHLMHRLARACTTESHPLYSLFMARLSSCIFEWDTEDFEQLLTAKKDELIATGIRNPTDGAVRKAVTKGELAKHCRRRTRGADKTITMIEDLILSLSSATDTLGVPLLREEVKLIWEEQRKHIACIQDPPGINLYTVTGQILKGGGEVARSAVCSGIDIP